MPDFPSNPNHGAPWGPPSQVPPPPPPPPGYGQFAYPPPPPPPRRSRAGWVVLILAGLGFVGVSALVFVFWLVGSAGSAFGAGSGSGLKSYTLEVAEGGKGPKSILMLHAYGIIIPDEGCGPALIAQLRHLHHDGEPDGIKVVLLDVDSPGGDVTTCDEIDYEIQQCKKKGIKFVAFFRNTAASGGYYISARADRIVACPTGITGSIGVIMMHWDASKLLNEKLGIRDESIKSGSYKDVPSFFRPMNDKEHEYVQNIVDKLYARFVGIVATGRNLKEIQIRDLQGKVLLADEAKDLGLVDDVGQFDVALATARAMSDKDAQVLTYRRKPNIWQVLQESGAKSSPLPEGVRSMMDLASRPRFLYLWNP